MPAWNACGVVFSRRTAAEDLGCDGQYLGAVAGVQADLEGLGPACAACTEPACHQLHTSSVTKGMNGAKRRCSTERAMASVARAESAPAASPSPYARAFTSST